MYLRTVLSFKLLFYRDLIPVNMIWQYKIWFWHLNSKQGLKKRAELLGINFNLVLTQILQFLSGLLAKAKSELFSLKRHGKMNGALACGGKWLGLNPCSFLAFFLSSGMRRKWEPANFILVSHSILKQNYSWPCSLYLPFLLFLPLNKTRNSFLSSFFINASIAKIYFWPPKPQGCHLKFEIFIFFYIRGLSRVQFPAGHGRGFFSPVFGQLFGRIFLL